MNIISEKQNNNYCWWMMYFWFVGIKYEFLTIKLNVCDIFVLRVVVSLIEILLEVVRTLHLYSLYGRVNPDLEYIRRLSKTIFEKRLKTVEFFEIIETIPSYGLRRL